MIEQAAKFAKWKHRNQVRKYTGEPYFVHCAEVGNILAKIGASENMICAGFMHDTIEDTDATFDEIEALFNREIAVLVWAVTDVSLPKDGNRAFRKAKDREHIRKGSDAAQTIKLADIISNTKSIVKHDAKFAVTYLAEKKELLSVMRTHLPLWKEAHSLVYGWTT